MQESDYVVYIQYLRIPDQLFWLQLYEPEFAQIIWLRHRNINFDRALIRSRKIMDKYLDVCWLLQGDYMQYIYAFHSTTNLI